MIVDIFFVVPAILIIWLGWYAGLARTFFAVLAGFIAIFAADKYPYQEGMNNYLIFSIAAVFIIMVGAFILRIINFFYLNIFDRIGGAFLSACVWTIIFINILVPSLNRRFSYDLSSSYVYVSAKTLELKMPIFKDYILPFLKEK
jgi:membrane-associated phospholipid phosphatase